MIVRSQSDLVLVYTKESILLKPYFTKKKKVQEGGGV